MVRYVFRNGSHTVSLNPVYVVVRCGSRQSARRVRGLMAVAPARWMQGMFAHQTFDFFCGLRSSPISQLEPDLLGEAFVLRFLSWSFEDCPQEEVETFVCEVWNGNGEQGHLERLNYLISFFVRCAQDFLVNPQVEDVKIDEFGNVLARVLSIIPDSDEGQHSHAISCFITTRISDPPDQSFMRYPADRALRP